MSVLWFPIVCCIASIIFCRTSKDEFYRSEEPTWMFLAFFVFVIVCLAASG